MNAYPHYFKALPPGCTHIDVYRVLSLFEVTDPALQHAAKKLLCAGARGAKDQGQDIAEAIATLQRWQQMRDEELPSPCTDFNLYTSPLSAPAAAYEKCECGMRDLAECPARFDEPGCGEPAPAAAPDDAERAAYLKRWEGAPEWAEWLAQDPDGRCDFFESIPAQGERGVWKLPDAIDFYSGAERFAGHNLLGPFRCEQRPTQEGGQEGQS